MRLSARVTCLGSMAALFLLAGCSTGAPVTVSEHYIPATDPFGTAVKLHARICRPSGRQGRLPLMLFVQGYNVWHYKRATQKLPRCDTEWERYFLDRGYETVSFFKSGYGDSGGAMAESRPGNPAMSSPDYWGQTTNPAEQIQTVLSYSLGHTAVDPQRVLLIGEGGGGPDVLRFRNSAASVTLRKVVLSPALKSEHMSIHNVYGSYGTHDLPDLMAMYCKLGAINPTPVLWFSVAGDNRPLHQSEEKAVQKFRSCGGKVMAVHLPFTVGSTPLREYLQPGGIAQWGRKTLAFAGGK